MSQAEQRTRPGPASAFRTLRWVRPDPRRLEYELRRRGELVAGLHWRDPEGTLAVADYQFRQWTLECVGFLTPVVRVRAAGSELNTALFRPRPGGEGLLLCAGCGLYPWQTCDMRRSEWAFFGGDGNRLVSFKSHGRDRWGASRTSEGTMEAAPWASRLPAYPLLVVTGWYLVLLYQRDKGLLTEATAEAAAG